MYGKLVTSFTAETRISTQVVNDKVIVVAHQNNSDKGEEILSIEKATVYSPEYIVKILASNTNVVLLQEVKESTLEKGA